ncbi:MAG: FkbM family methyltransferase [bacterium]|nr:FkbM family methyltransferase [bacterium]
MSKIVNRINEEAIKLKNENNVIRENCSVIKIPFYGYIDIEIDGTSCFTMFSNNDDFVAKNYFWKGANAYEPMSLSLWSKLASKSKCTFDIGSYSGIYSLAAAKANSKSKVHAFEVLNRVFTRLLINKKINDIPNLSVINKGISDVKGFINLNVYSGDQILVSGSSIVEKNIGREIYKKEKVEVTTIDDYVNEVGIKRLDLVKIDAEGAEHLVFNGGRKTILKDKPDIICELLNGAQFKELENYFLKLGYNYYKIKEQDNELMQINTLTPAKTMNDLNVLISQKSFKELKNIIRNI